MSVTGQTVMQASLKKMKATNAVHLGNLGDDDDGHEDEVDSKVIWLVVCVENGDEKPATMTWIGRRW